MSEAESSFTIGRHSDLGEDEARAMIGRKVVRVDASEYQIILTFDDGSHFVAHGHTYNGCRLGTTLYGPGEDF